MKGKLCLVSLYVMEPKATGKIMVLPITYSLPIASELSGPEYNGPFAPKPSQPIMAHLSDELFEYSVYIVSIQQEQKSSGILHEYKLCGIQPRHSGFGVSVKKLDY